MMLMGGLEVSVSSQALTAFR